LALPRMRSVLSIFLCLFFVVPTHAQRRPTLVPNGWTQEFVDRTTKTRRFVSPDGRSSLISRQGTAQRTALGRQIDEIAHQPGEQITYLSRGSSWVAVSGYKGDKIFYRKSNLACGGKNWHHIELLYPREQKRQMDATVTFIAHAMTKYGDDCG
jgi:hypothetical protein